MFSMDDSWDFPKSVLGDLWTEPLFPGGIGKAQSGVTQHASVPGCIQPCDNTRFGGFHTWGSHHRPWTARLWGWVRLVSYGQWAL